MTAPEFAFPVNELDAGGKHFQLPIRAAWLRGALEDTQVTASERDGELDVRLSKSGVDVVIRGTLAADLVVPCSRCLEPTAVPIREEVSALAVPASSSALTAAAGRPGNAKKDKKPKNDDDLDDTELSSEAADVVLYEGDHLVLDELVRDELLLAIPMIPLCSEACPGISPGHSAIPEESAVDPRLLPLLKLKNKT